MQEMSTDIRGPLPLHSAGALPSTNQAFNRSCHAQSTGVPTSEYAGKSLRAVIGDGQRSSGQGDGTAPESGRSNLLDGKAHSVKMVFSIVQYSLCLSCS